MMEPVIGSSRLFAAFENMGLSAGADLRSPFGPSGSPAESMVRAFDEAMTAPAQNADTVPGVQAPGGMPERAEPTLIPNNGTVDAVPPPTAAGPAEHMAAPRSDPVQRASEISQSDLPPRNVHGRTAVQEAGTVQSPVELYQAQYQLGLLRAHMTTMLQSSQSLTQSLETALKQSG